MSPTPQIVEGNGSAPRVLLIDDDRTLCSSLERLLRLEGYEVALAHTAHDGLQRAIDEHYDLLVLDVMLPSGDGRVLLKKLRTTSEVPVIMLTARGDEKDRIHGLEAGADDYLPKPFHVRELLARMRSVLKRRIATAASPQIVKLGDLEIDPVTRIVRRNGEDITLTGTEFEILLLLVKSFGRVVTRDEIAEACLGRTIGAFDRSVDNHISNLRKKLGATWQDKERIQSLRGTGYIYTAGEGA